MKTIPPAIVVCCPHCGKNPAEPVAIAPQPEPAPAPPVAAYVVTKGGTFAMGGQMCRVAVGAVVRLNAYGKDGIDRMLARGIELEPQA